MEPTNLTSLAARAPFQFPGNLILSVSPFLITAREEEAERRGRGDNKLCLLIKVGLGKWRPHVHADEAREAVIHHRGKKSAVDWC